VVCRLASRSIERQVTRVNGIGDRRCRSSLSIMFEVVMASHGAYAADPVGG
jgi:hypothetical protein